LPPAEHLSQIERDKQKLGALFSRSPESRQG
jgi:hypothetical protein